MTPKAIITIIAAVADDGAIGRRGDLPFHISADLRRFKALTLGKPIVMGRKTFESLPGGALPGRRNIVVSRNRDLTLNDAEVASSLAEAIDMCGDAPEVMIIGGGEIYRQALPLASCLELTHIHATVDDADTHFPTLGPEWHITDRSEPATDPRTGITFTFATHRKRPSLA